MILKATPRNFGNVAAAAICEGVDVSRFVVRHALFNKKKKAQDVEPEQPETAPVAPFEEEIFIDDGSIVLESLTTSPEEEPADLPVSDFYKDIV